MSCTIIGNYKPGIVVPIPQSKDYVSFSKNRKTQMVRININYV